MLKNDLSAGVARGCGWQHLAAWTNLIAFYLIGMPLALLFGFKLGVHDKVSTLNVFNYMSLRALAQGDTYLIFVCTCIHY